MGSLEHGRATEVEELFVVLMITVVQLWHIINVCHTPEAALHPDFLTVVLLSTRSCESLVAYGANYTCSVQLEAVQGGIPELFGATEVTGPTGATGATGACEIGTAVCTVGDVF